MIDPQTIQWLNDLSSEELRELIAHASGIHAHRDGDGGALMAEALRRVADRLNNKPRKAA